MSLPEAASDFALTIAVGKCQEGRMQRRQQTDTEAQAPSVGGATPTARLFKVAADKLQPAPHPSGQASARGPQRASLSAEERFKFDLAMVKRTVRFGVRGEKGYPFGGSSVA